jgi:hypothetical protein
MESLIKKAVKLGYKGDLTDSDEMQCFVANNFHKTKYQLVQANWFICGYNSSMCFNLPISGSHLVSGDFHVNSKRNRVEHEAVDSDGKTYLVIY